MDQNIPPQFETTYEWEIENFSMCPQSIGECLRSNTIYVDSIDLSEYQLILYPRGRLSDEYETPLCQLVCLQESEFDINVTMHIAFEDQQKEMEKKNFEMNTEDTIEFPIELRKEPLEPGRFALLPGELFTVRCTITLNYDPHPDEVHLDTLSGHLERLYRSELFSDFCLISFAENRRFPVHKMMLATRCPGLAKKMGIESCKEGVLDHVTAEALEVFLLYVYTGMLRESLSSDVLNEIYSMSVEYGMDDLKNDVFPLEICTLGRTTIKIDHHVIAWTPDNFLQRVDEDDWPSRTFMDLVIGRFDTSFSVVTDGDGKTSAQIDLKCLRLDLDRSLTVKCVVQVIRPLDGIGQILCKGEHKFDRKNLTQVFSLIGDLLVSIRELPESLELVFDFRVSHPRGSDHCDKVEIINALGNPRPIWKRSLHRLSKDLAIAFKNNYLGKGMEGWTYSDLRVQNGDKPAIPAHRCILSARSDRFKSMIGVDTSEIDIGLRNQRFDLHDFLRYVYSGKFSENHAAMLNLLNVYIASVRYEVPTLAEKCLALIRSRMDLKNLKLLLQKSQESNDMELHKISGCFMRNNKNSIRNTPEWAEIKKEFPCHPIFFSEPEL